MQRGRGPTRWRSGLPYGIARLQLAQRGAHAPQARVLGLRPAEGVRWRVHVCAHSNAGCSLEAAADPSEHGRAPRERAVSLAQWGFVGYEPTPTSAARRAHAASARAAPPPERERAVARSRVRTLERRLLVRGRGWHVGARPCTEGKGRLAGVVGFHRAGDDSNQRGAARTRRKRAWHASSLERACGGAFMYALTRTPAARWRPQLARRSTAVHQGRGPSRLRSGLS